MRQKSENLITNFQNSHNLTHCNCTIYNYMCVYMYSCLSLTHQSAQVGFNQNTNVKSINDCGISTNGMSMDDVTLTDKKVLFGLESSLNSKTCNSVYTIMSEQQ